MRYDAFISYSHAADGKLAPALQSALHRLAKPWYRRRALRIFRDQTSLAATPELWPSIETALESSTHFMLLASPEAADSPWVQREVSWWLTNRSPRQLLLVWTGGELVWDDAASDFDWTRTDALPALLGGAFASEPLWIDLRWARSAEQLSLKDPRFLQAVGDLAAPLHGRPKEDLLGEDVRQHQRALRLAGAAIATLLVLMVAAVVAAVVAVGQRDEADRNANLAATETARAGAETIRADAEAAVARTAEAEAQSQAVVAQAARSTAEAETVRAENEAARADAEADTARTAEQTAETRRVEAEEARDEARAQARVALSRQLTAQAISDRTGALDLRLLLAAEATRLSREGVDARGNLLTLLNANPALDRFLHGAEGIEIGDLAFSPGGALLAAARRDGSTILWDVASGEPIGESPRVGQGVVPRPLVAFSPDGRTLATKGEGGLIVLWDVATRQPVGTPLVVPSGAAMRSDLDDLIFGPGGQTLYSAGSSLLMWDLTADVPRAERFGDDFALEVAVSPDGQLVASDGRSPPESVVLWDTGTRERIGEPLTMAEESLATPESTGDRPVITEIAFSPDGTLLAASDTSGRIVVWDAATRQRVRDLSPSATGSGIRDIAFSPDSHALVSTGYYGEIIVWDIVADPLTGVIVGHHNGTRAVAYSPDGRWLATGAEDGSVVLWDPARWSALGQGMISDDIFLGEVAVSPDGQLVAAGTTDGNVVLWEAATGQAAGELAGERHENINGVSFSSDGRHLAAGNSSGDLALWDVGARQLVALREDAHARPISDVTFSPDNRFLASGAADGVVGIWDVTADQIVGETLVGVGDVQALAFSPDGQMLAAGFGGTGPGSTVVWDVAQRSVVARIPGSAVDGVAFSPDGRQLITAQGYVIFRDTTTYQTIGEPLVPAAGGVASLALSHDGQILATGGSDGTIQLWDVPSRQPIGQPLTGHEEWVDALAFVPSGLVLASRGGGDYTAPLLWQVGLPAWQTIACQMARRNLSRAEWAEFLGDEDYRKTCPDLPEQGEQATPTPPSVPDRPLDLAAMVSSSDGVGQVGGVVDSYSLTLDQQAREVADARGEDVAAVRAVLEVAGWQRQEGIAFASPDNPPLGDTQAPVNLRGEFTVTEYETADGAAAGFTYLELEVDTGGTPVPLAIPFGEQVIATYESGIDSSGAPYENERLAFRFDNLVAHVEVWGYGNAMEIIPGLADGYGAELRERIARVFTDGGPGLSNRVLRLVGDEIADDPDSSRYLRLAGRDLPTYWESMGGLPPPGGPADRIRQPVDSYRAYAEIGEAPAPVYTVFLYAYASSEIASGVFAALRDDLSDWATPMAVASASTLDPAQVENGAFGEESITISQNRWIGEPGGIGSYELRGHATWARVGAEIIAMFVETPAEPPRLAVTNELMTAQVACLRATTICEPAPVPEALRMVVPATPGPASATPQSMPPGASG